MIEREIKYNLKIDKRLYEFINNEILKGLDFKEDSFWKNFSDFIYNFAPKNKALPNTLEKATSAFAKSSVMTELFGDAWVDHFSLTRRWEAHCYDKQKKSDHDWHWMLDRYFEII